MKILYCALAIDIAGVHGGATHVREVTNGLAALGHDVQLIARSGPTSIAHERLHARMTRVNPPPKFAWVSTPRVRAIARHWQPDIIMERFYTFAGGGMVAAHARNIPAILEVNAPVFDPPGTTKDRMDRLTGRIMRRWATQQCRWANAIVTPLAATVPPAMRGKVIPLQWGANTRMFDPARHPRSGADACAVRQRYGIPLDAPVVGFVGSFRAWHGAAEATHAFRLVRDRVPDAHLLLVGDGPERETLERAAVESAMKGIVFTGAISYDDVPRHLAVCDVAVAPFVPSLHAPLHYFGFYWSPLKVFEAMAMGIPVVTTVAEPLTEIVRGAGITVPERDRDAFAAAIVSLLCNPQKRTAMGAVGRARVIAEWSWEAHCRHLDAIMTNLVSHR